MKKTTPTPPTSEELSRQVDEFEEVSGKKQEAMQEAVENWNKQNPSMGLDLSKDDDYTAEYIVQNGQVLPHSIQVSKSFSIEESKQGEE